MNIDTAAIRRLRDQLLASSDAVRVGRAGERGDTDVVRDAVVRRVEPFAEAMYLVMVADDDPGSVEHRALEAAIAVLADAQLSPDDIAAMLSRFEENVRRHGSEARTAAIGNRVGHSREDRETAFALGAVVALADERVDIRENRVLEWIRTYCGISERQMESLLRSIS